MADEQPSTSTDPKRRTVRQDSLASRSTVLKEKGDILSGARVYLSGPMDFVASRAEEKRTGWRNRVGEFLRSKGATVFDPWQKPRVVGMPHYGKEDEFTTQERQRWTFEESDEGDRARAELGDHFWPTLHIDLRMVDASDFLVAYVPTNIYSVGTAHEIVMARLQHKPVLFVSPSIRFPALRDLRTHLEETGDAHGSELLEELTTQVPILENPSGIPSMWYMGLVDAHYFFDGFGFEPFMEEFEWEAGGIDARERDHEPVRPLLEYLEKLNRKIPQRFDLELDAYVENSDWLIFEQSDFEDESEA
jgi:hypothetical protein